MSTLRSRLQDFLYHEARLLDDRQWDEWLACYSPTARFWMPAWDDNDQLVDDPHAHVSLIYYPNRQGLEDRVFRIKTERSSASTPEPRTAHFIANLEVLSDTGTTASLRFNWQTLSHRYKATDLYFGTSFYDLDLAGEQPLITGKKVVLKNDYIHQVVDIYHL